ncbi:uncharacterized protein METZ01_LOCUS389492, partial [marine metagenome]
RFEMDSIAWGAVPITPDRKGTLAITLERIGSPCD